MQYTTTEHFRLCIKLVIVDFVLIDKCIPTAAAPALVGITLLVKLCKVRHILASLTYWYFVVVRQSVRDDVPDKALAVHAAVSLPLISLWGSSVHTTVVWCSQIVILLTTCRIFVQKCLPLFFGFLIFVSAVLIEHIRQVCGTIQFCSRCSQFCSGQNAGRQCHDHSTKDCETAFHTAFQSL